MSGAVVDPESFGRVVKGSWETAMRGMARTFRRAAQQAARTKPVLDRIYEAKYGHPPPIRDPRRLLHDPEGGC